MEMVMEKQVERAPLSVRLSDEEWAALDELQSRFGDSTRSQVIKRLIAAAKVRRASVQFPQTAQN